MTQLPGKYSVNSAAPHKADPEPERNWPRWYCPRCQAKHYLDIDVLMAVVRLTCSTCKTAWNVKISFESATAAKPKTRRTHAGVFDERAREDDESGVTMPC